MPDGVRGALIRRISTRHDGPLDITWLAAGTPGLPLGRIRLHWEPAARPSIRATRRTSMVGFRFCSTLSRQLTADHQAENPVPPP